MNKVSKVAVTVLLILIFFVVAVLLQEAGSSRTFIALIALGLFYGIRKMWKKAEDDSPSEIKLNKENNDLTKQ